MARFYLFAVSALILGACSSLHLPNPGFEDALVLEPGRGAVASGFGNTQSLDFNEFEASEDRSSVHHKNVASLLLSGSIGLAKNLEVSLRSFSLLPFPSIAGVKYRYYTGGGNEGLLDAAVTAYYGFSAFGNQGGYSPIGGACGQGGKLCVSDPNGKWVSGKVSAYILGFPLSYTHSDRWRFSFVPQVTYFEGVYSLSRLANLTDMETTQFKLFGLRKSAGLACHYSWSGSWETQLAVQYHEYGWNGLRTGRQLSAFFGVFVPVN